MCVFVSSRNIFFLFRAGVIIGHFTLIMRIIIVIIITFL